ncbi:substrate-binding domain-containing protein [Streptomyces sp. CJ_13]|uniref:substrate-binding domain-containing protein n=1 Tax=Streptomyces sp. CJ_13 TaxID=2724943 RepID=UPI002029D30F|nr:substrate-binding domain-containing protein [Streptomyces sp. CJ_13]
MAHLAGAGRRRLHRTPGRPCPRCPALRADHPLTAKPLIAPVDLPDVRIVGLPGNSTSCSYLDAWLEESGIRPVFDASVADWDTAILLAELGLGCAVVPALPGWLGPSHTGLRLVPIPALPVLYAGWGRPALGALSSRARTFADTVSRNCAGNRSASRSAVSGGRIQRGRQT